MAEHSRTVRDAKLIKWLGEAHTKESELEADLAAHIAITEKPAYKKRLRQHLTETREHKRAVASRIKALGGKSGDLPVVPALTDGVREVAGKAVATVKGQVGAARALVTERAETHVRNAQEELREEQVEIGIYTRIGAFAEAVGDRETQQLAKRILRDEERMSKYLMAELPRLVRDLVRAEVPREERATPTRRRPARAKRGKTSATRRSRGSRRAATVAR